MTILDRTLEELRRSKGPVRSTDLAARLRTSQAALAGMVAVLVVEGKLTGGAEELTDEGAACGASCVGFNDCPFIAEMTEIYALVIGPATRR